MIARVFPRATTATPKDDYAFVGDPPLFLPEDIDEVHVSVLFTWDLPEAERLAKAWRHVAPVKIGGPALNEPGGEFEPGKYIAKGNVITSRGCPNRCWFCSVPKREGGQLRELPICDGWNVLDDNLLACSRPHVNAVFEMLLRQKQAGHRITFKGGLEAKLLRQWHIDWFKKIRPKQAFFAYDTPDDYEPLVDAAGLLRDNGILSRNTFYCYCLIGHPRDSFDEAEKRLNSIKALGISPFAMLYRDSKGKYSQEWRRFQSSWARPAFIWGNRDNRHLSRQ